MKKSYPEEQRLAALTKDIRDKAKKANRETTEAEDAKIAEYKRQLGSMKFKRLAEKRVGAALKQIRNVGSLAAKSYTSTPGQVKEVVDALVKAVENVNSAFSAPQAKQSKVFTLSAA